MIHFDCVTLFPQMFAALTESGITSRALKAARYSLELWNPRDFTSDNYRTVDDRPYGGGPGMVMLAEPLDQAIRAAKARVAGSERKVIYLSPQGRKLDHDKVMELARGPGMVMLAEPLDEAIRAAKARVAGSERKVIYLSPQGGVLAHGKVMELAAGPGAVLLCGRYESVDERLIRRAVDEELSIGDYVLSGGELAAMVLIDAVVRQLPGVLGDEDSAAQDSFVGGLLDCPHYTRPEEYAGERVPPVLLSGNHAEIERWRLKQALGRTWQRRPDLLEKRALSAAEAKLLEEFKREQNT